VEKICRHFGDCGGCESQDRPYLAQLAAKEDWVRRVSAPFAPEKFHPIRPSPDVFFYRNKMEFVFSPSESGPILGLRQKGRFDGVVDLRECLLMSPETPLLLEAVRRWASAEGLPAYGLKSRRGFLRYLVIREGKNTGRRLVHLVTAPGDLPRDSFLRALDESGARVDAAVWSVNAEASDVARGAAPENLRGAGFIEETLGGLPFRISPAAFFQTNTRGAEVLYGVVREFLGPAAGLLVDFYCGSGAIGLFCAGAAERVLGVELHAPSVDDARHNARVQGAGRAEFLAMDAAAFAGRPELLDLWRRPGTAAVLDPPRPGLAPAVRRLLMEHPVDRFVYVSCNPKALAADLPILNDAYRLESVAPVDLFPHTPHVETVVLLRRRAPAGI
jgi:23S rRNA (uracil1939-C5)-methyltransferase